MATFFRTANTFIVSITFSTIGLFLMLFPTLMEIDIGDIHIPLGMVMIILGILYFVSKIFCFMRIKIISFVLIVFI